MRFFYLDDPHLRLFNELWAQQLLLFADQKQRSEIKQLNFAHLYSNPPRRRPHAQP